MIWSWTCPICASEMPGYAQLHERHQDGQLTVLGISLDGSAGVMEAWALPRSTGQLSQIFWVKDRTLLNFFISRPVKR